MSTRPTGMRAGFRRRYGASPLHLLGHLLAFAVIAFAIRQIFKSPAPLEYVGALLALAVLHDLVLLPFYSWLDGLGRRFAGRLQSRLAPRRARTVPLVNHFRAPALISGILLLIYAPLIAKRADSWYMQSTGHPIVHYLRNWLLITAVLFAGSALIYAIRVLRQRRPA
jgi:hypothetical protein